MNRETSRSGRCCRSRLDGVGLGWSALLFAPGRSWSGQPRPAPSRREQQRRPAQISSVQARTAAPTSPVPVQFQEGIPKYLGKQLAKQFVETLLVVRYSEVMLQNYKNRKTTISDFELEFLRLCKADRFAIKPCKFSASGKIFEKCADFQNFARRQKFSRRNSKTVHFT